MGRLQSVQILRFVAAFAVVLLHANQSLFPFGAAGVDVFFVISGFIISRISARVGIGQFIIGRVRRIYPIYWICSAPVVWYYLQAGQFDAGTLITSITLWPVVGDYGFPYLHQGWTLSFEMLFYSGAAFIIWRPDTRNVFIVAYTLAVALAMTTDLALFRFIGNPMIAEFLFGVLIAQSKPLGRDIGAGLLLLAVVGFVGASFFAGQYAMAEGVLAVTQPLRPFIWGLPSAMLLLGALQFEPGGRLADALAYLGDASYSIYLVHTPLIFILTSKLPWPVALVVALASGVLVYRYIEQPLLNALRVRARVPRPQLV